MNSSPDLYEADHSLNKPVPSKAETWLAEADHFSSTEPRFVSRKIGMSFNRAQFTSTSESDDELSDPLPLG